MMPSNMTAIYQRIKQLQAQGMPQNQIDAILKSSDPIVNTASLEDAERMVEYMQIGRAHV